MTTLLLFLTFMTGDRGLIPDRQLPLDNNQANLFYEQEQYQEALKLYLDLYGQDTGNGALAYNIANTYAALGDMEKAREFYEKASGADHEEASQRANFNMGNLAMNSNELQEAVGRFVDYLQANPDDEDAKRNLEIALRRLEQQPPQQQQQQDDQQENQEQQQQEQQQNQQQQNEGEEEQEQQQQEQSESEQENEQQDQPQPGENQQQDNEPQQGQDQQQQQQGAEQQQENMDESVKEQILKALAEREEQQQKEYQQRKIGGSKRRAKDW